MTSGSGDRPRKEGCHGGGVYFFSCLQSARLQSARLRGFQKQVSLESEV